MTSPSSQVIPEAAVEAAAKALVPYVDDYVHTDEFTLDVARSTAKVALEAAAPYATFHSPEDLLLGVYTMTEPELQETLRTAKAEAWGEAWEYACEQNKALRDFTPTNPYRPAA